ncbi:hypothetical protein [Paenibacillus sp. y28]|uniref:hypothetical protein n=1 Tax=Paenibacillus sp. y28 TaxID=3129110 RepID=UPI003019ED7E
MKPQYELGAFRAQIEQEAPAASKLGPERLLAQDSGNEEAGPRWYQSKALFNSVIVAVSLLLVMILFRLMRRGGAAR